MNPVAFKVMNVVIPPVGGLLCRPAGHGRIAQIESRNKIRTIEGVEFAAKIVGGGQNMKELVDRVQRSDSHRALWLAEGLGLHHGRSALARGENVRNILTEGDGREILPSMLLMVHAGMAMAFARHHLDRLGPAPAPGEVRETTQRIVNVFEANAISGYAGIGYEAWGMATRFFYARQKLFPSVVDALQAIDPAHVPHFWHGAGRASYFVEFMPRWKEPWPAFKLVRQDARDQVSRLNLIAGVASAFVLVNMRTPEIMEAILRERIANFPPEDAAAFAQGIVCSMVLRQDTVPNETHTMQFVRHVPSTDVSGLWERIVAAPSRQALDIIYPYLRVQRRLDEVTCYRPLNETLSAAAANPS